MGVIIALVIPKLLEVDQDVRIRFPLPPGALFIVAVGRILVSFMVQTVIFSRSGTEFRLLMVQRVSHGTKLNMLMMTMSIRTI